ncbi:transcription factor bHLH30-like [Lolium rigidum]|uniref:transcription factor bHLH30-like n=1 Tax=Lolium rigidum TaxID=89674 RepID=UPI001F5DCD23|nr:transcription factor bHLH30-like [Lolium rigidum]
MATDGECSAPVASRKGATPVRSHSEAERKRRQRINAHLATLRTLVPSASRMDKAALLGEVVRHVRELRGRADDATEGLAVVPGEGDEVGVEEETEDRTWLRRPDDDDDSRWRRRVRAWVCCADRPGLMSDLGRAVRSVGSARPVRAEIATVGGRTRSVLELDYHAATPPDTDKDRAVALSTLRAALRTVLLNRDELLAAASADAEGYKRPRLSSLV